jgi:hypothetical protein
MTTECIQNQFPEQDARLAPLYGAEVNQFHTRLLRMPLATEESRAYWENLRVEIPKDKRVVVAFEERWFGNKSMARVETILKNFAYRFDAYPVALEVLQRWCPSNPTTRQNICHWHLQLSDPIYRSFSGIFLEQRRLHPEPTLDRDIVVRWVSGQLNNQWSSATTIRMATALMTCATTAGLCSDNPGTRRLVYPKVTDEALAYWLYFLRYLSFEGSLLNNPYLASVGLSESFLEQRLLRLPGLSFKRMGDLQDMGWQYPDLKSWAIHCLGLNWEDGK